MSVQLDWNVEAPDGEHRVGEDPAALDAWRKQRRFLLRAAVVLGAILAAVGIGVWNRYRQVQDLRREMLIATVESEALALRIGDLEGFIKRQSGDGLWITRQTRLFQEFQALNPRVQIPGEIIELRIDGDQAEVTVREVIDGAPAEATWIYEYTRQGWRHVATPAEPWSRNRARSRPGFEFSYNEQDESLVDVVDAALARMRAETIGLTGYEDLPTLQVWIEPLGESIGWLDTGQSALVIPARTAAGRRITALDAAMRSEIARVLALRWTQAMFAELGVTPYHAWMEEEMATLLRRHLDPAAPPAPILGPLIAAFGPELIPTFIESMRDRPLPTVALPAAMRATAPRGLSGDALLEHLTYLLQAEIGMRGRLDTSYGSADGRVRVVFTDMLANGFPSYPVDPFVSSGQIDPASLTVDAAEQVGGVLWVEVHYTIVWSESGSTTSSIAYVPFRNDGGHWVRTEMLIPQDWGGDLAAQGERITLHYTGLDAPYVAGLLPEMEQMYEQLAADFGLEEMPNITIEVSMTPWSPGMLDPRAISLRVASPHLRPCPEREPACIEFETKSALVSWALGNARGWSPDQNILMYYPSTPIEQAIADWELARLSPSGGGPPPPTGTTTTVPTLESLWLDHTYWSGDQEFDPRVASLGLTTLFDVLVEQYGIEAMHELIERLDRAISMETWLRASIGIGVADVEPEWRARFEEALRENGYTLTSGSAAWAEPYLMIVGRRDGR